GPGTFGAQVVWLVCDEQGRVVDQSQPAADPEFLAETAQQLRASDRPTKRLTWQGERWQFHQRWLQSAEAAPSRSAAAPPPADLGGRKSPALSITAGVSLEPVRTALGQLGSVLVGLSLGVWLVALGLGRVVCRRALQPVRRMALAARAMDGADPSQR